MTKPKGKGPTRDLSRCSLSLLDCTKIIVVIRIKNMQLEPGPLPSQFQRVRNKPTQSSEDRCNLTLGYWNVNGIDYLSAWTIGRILQREVEDHLAFQFASFFFKFEPYIQHICQKD